MTDTNEALPKVEELLPPPPRIPDHSYKGCINYEINWFGNQAEVKIFDMTYEHRVAIMHQAHEDFVVLLHQMKTNPKGIKDHFTTTEKAGIMKTRFMLEKFLMKFLNAVWARMHEQNAKSIVDAVKPKNDEYTKKD